MATPRALTIALAAALFLVSAARSAEAGACDSLTALAIPQGTVTSTHEVAAGAFTPPAGPGAAARGRPACSAAWARSVAWR